MAMILISFLLVSFTHAYTTSTLTLTPPVDDPSYSGPFEIDIYEMDYCISSPVSVADLAFAYLNNTALCEDLTVPSSVQGKIVLTPYWDTGCPVWTVAKKVNDAGAIGFISTSGSNGILAPPGLATVPSIFCYGVSGKTNETADLIGWVSGSEDVRAAVSRSPTNQNDVAVLKAMQAQTFDSSKIWNLQSDPCIRSAQAPPGPQSWKGVDCKAGRVTNLVMPFPVNGRLPDDFCKLEKLSTLQIKDDLTFTGIPFCSGFQLLYLAITATSMATVDRLFEMRITSLDLSDNLLTGSLDPTNWSTVLSSMILAGNDFSGSVPESIFARLPFLNLLDLSRNNLNGPIPDFSQSSNLRFLYLFGNKFDNFSVSSVTKPSSLQELRVGSNLLPSCPQVLFDGLTKVTILELYSNKLTALPDMTTMAQLNYLDISHNKIVGNLVLTTSMGKVLASNNALTSLSPLYPDFNRLTDLDLSYNNFTGPLVIPLMSSLRSLLFSNNGLTSVQFSSVPQIVTTDFANNNITGTLAFGFVPKTLLSLDLSYNNFSGSISGAVLQHTTTLRLVGNPLLNYGLSSLLPLGVSFNFSLFQVYDSLGMECPTYKINGLEKSVLTLDPSYHNNLLCRCLPNYYRPAGITSNCVRCLPNAICPGREDPLIKQNNANILAQAGYFPLPNPDAPVVFVPCRFGVVFAEDPRNPCNPNVDHLVEAAALNQNISVAAVKFQCSTGYEERLCSKCMSGWFRKEGRCLICNGRPEYPMFLIVIVMIFLAACAFFVQRQPVDMSTTSINPDGWTFEPKQRVYDFVPLILHFFQVSTIILTKLQSLDVMQTMNSLFVTASFSTPQSGIGFECGLPVFQGFVTQYLAVVIFPPILACVLAAFFAGRIMYRASKNQPQQWNMSLYQYIYGLFSMFEAIHFPLVTYVLGVFQCTKDPLTGVSYFTDHPYLLCNSISAAGKVFPLLLYPIGLVGFFVSWVFIYIMLLLM
jgi:Leucine-rich repeat (LRR) protein